MKTIIALTAILLAPTVFAQTLAEKKVYAEQETDLAKEVVHFNQQCQSDIKVNFDWANFQFKELENRSAASICNEAMAGVARVCNSSTDGLKAVQDNIKTIICGYDSPRKVELKNNILYFGMNFNSANDADFVEDYLMNNL